MFLNDYFTFKSSQIDPADEPRMKNAFYFVSLSDSEGSSVIKSELIEKTIFGKETALWDSAISCLFKEKSTQNTI